MTIDSNGGLAVMGAGAELREQAPEIYQESRSGRARVSGRYRLLDHHTAGFNVDSYDTSKPLIIDPVVSYATYFGGSGTGGVNGIAVDASNNVYLAGWTESLNFPILGGVQATNGGGVDAFVAKLSADGSALLYATYIGGASEDSAAAIAVNATGQAYVTGYTTSSNFPLVAPIQSVLRGGRDAFVLKLNAAGSKLRFSTYFGGSGWDQGTAIAVDAAGNAYIAGDTQSTDLTVLSAVQPTFGGATDAFVTEFTLDGVVSFSTYLGGSGIEHGGGIAVDPGGGVYVGGGTYSSNFPVLNAIQATNGGIQEAFLTELNPGGASFAYSTYFGGSGSAYGSEQINAVAVDSAGDAYIAGVTNSVNFPVTSGAIRTTYNGMQDAFAAEISASVVLVYSSYLGGTTSNWASGIAVDSSGNAYVAGNTSSVDFPVVNAVQLIFGGAYDAFISQINPGGTALIFSTYYGGSGSDVANAIALDAAADMYVAGETASVDFPLTAAFEATYPGSATGFVLSLAAALPAATNPSPANGATGVATSPVLSWVETGATSFDVYFGTSSTPPYVVTTSETTYSPGPLIAGQTYYWFIVANNATSTMSSPTWSFTVQPGATCSYGITPASATAASGGGSGSVSASAASGCIWTAASNASWVTITSGNSGSGAGTVNYSVAANGGTSARSGTLTIAGLTFTESQGVSEAALLTITMNSAGSFAAGEQNVAYLVSVSNTTGAGSTSGAVTVTEVPPSGLTIVSMAGTGWTCSGNSCTRSDALSAGASYPAITVTANVALTATSPLTNTVTVSGGGSAPATASDTAVLTGGLEFYAITPCRAVDTRATQDMTGAFGPPSLAAYSARSFPILSSSCGIPANAQAYSLNVTVVPSGPLSFLSIWPSNQSYPGVSTINSSDGSTLANAAIVPAGTDSGGSITVVAGNPTDLILDVNGYFAPPGSGLLFYPVTQCRVVDTRAAGSETGADGPPSLAAYSSRNFPIAGNCGIPSSAQAFSLNFTVVPSGPLSFLSTWPTGQSYPGVSTLNSTEGTMIANSAIVPAGTGGAITVVAGNPTDLMIDAGGYFASPASGGLSFYPVTPCRMVDTRTGQGKTGAFGPPSLVANTSRSFPLLTAGCNIPSTAQVYALNVTVVPPGPLELDRIVAERSSLPRTFHVEFDQRQRDREPGFGGGGRRRSDHGDGRKCNGCDPGHHGVLCSVGGQRFSIKTKGKSLIGKMLLGKYQSGIRRRRSATRAPGGGWRAG